MPSIRLDPHDLLEYNARYCVLICRECQYAIQKSALESHLLRHRIYRGERQRLLSSIAKLDLLEPDHVLLPSPTSPPIDALPIISGHRCTEAGCESLYASSKRMRRHQSEVHGLNEAPSNSPSCGRPVKLQTFFRGTKLRYFEVSSSQAAGPAERTPLITTGDIDERYDEQGHDVDTESPLQRAPPSRVPSPPPSSSLVNFDLETLTYFHYFTTTTSLTLPSPEQSQSATHYWQTDVVLLALRRRWLMCGLLAISACHLAVLADDTTIEEVHRERSAQFFSSFSSEWEEATMRDLGVMVAGVEEEEKKVGAQMRCLLDRALAHPTLRLCRMRIIYPHTRLLALRLLSHHVITLLHRRNICIG